MDFVIKDDVVLDSDMVSILSNELSEADSYDEFFKKNKKLLENKNKSKLWDDILKDSNISKNKVIAETGIGYSYFYYILKGEKTPSRDIIVKICLVMDLPLEMCQRILFTNDWACLSPKIKRDSVLIYALNNHLTIEQTNAILKKHRIKTLQSKP